MIGNPCVVVVDDVVVAVMLRRIIKMKLRVRLGYFPVLLADCDRSSFHALLSIVWVFQLLNEQIHGYQDVLNIHELLSKSTDG